MSHDGAESVSCLVCTNDFDNRDHEPVALPACGHTFCRPCILRLERTQRILRCPECRRPHEGEAPANLPVNDLLLNVVSQSQRDNACVKTDDLGSIQRGGARRKHFSKKMKKGRKGDNKSYSHPSCKAGEESDQGSFGKNGCNEVTDNESDSGKGSVSEDDGINGMRKDDEDLSSSKEDSDDSLSPRRKKRDTCAKRREHDSKKECSDSDNDSPADGSRTKWSNNSGNPLLSIKPTLNDINRNRGAADQLVNIDLEIIQPEIIQPQRRCQSQFWTKKKLKIIFVFSAFLIVVICMLISHPVSYWILNGLGFTSKGTRKNSHASSWQSKIQKSNSGKIDGNSYFATLQKASTKGFNITWKVAITSLGAVVGGFLFLPCVFCCYKRILKRTVDNCHIPLASDEDTTV